MTRRALLALCFVTLSVAPSEGRRWHIRHFKRVTLPKQKEIQIVDDQPHKVTTIRVPMTFEEIWKLRVNLP